MTAPQPVIIHRPYRGWSAVIGSLVGAVADRFLTAWIAMMLLPVAVHVHPGYWQTIAGVVVIRALLPAGHLLDSWSIAGRKPKR